MKRRNLLAAFGIAASGGVAVGTGAFTSVEAERTVNIEVANEDEALLAMEPDLDSENADFVNQGTDGVLFFDINDVVGGDGEGTGAGTESVYTFDKVFNVSNQGTQPVFFETQFENIESLDSVGFYAGDADDKVLDGDTVAELPVGETADMGIKIDTSGMDVELGEDREIDNINAQITASDDSGDAEIVDDITVGNGGGGGGG